MLYYLLKWHNKQNMWKKGETLMGIQPLVCVLTSVFITARSSACFYILACCFSASVKLDGDFRSKLSLNPPQWHSYGHDPLTLMFLGEKQTFNHDEKSCKTSQCLAQEHLFMQPCSGLHHSVSSQGDWGDLRNLAIRSHSLLTTRNNTGQVARCNIRPIIPSAASVSSCNSKCGATIDI